MLITLLTIACLGVTFLVSFYKLWHNPPVLNVNLSGLSIPGHFTLSPLHIQLTTKVVPADVELASKEEPIPEEILDYISQESEIHAQDARKRRVRAMKAETGSWDVAFRLLQREDNALE